MGAVIRLVLIAVCLFLVAMSLLDLDLVRGGFWAMVGYLLAAPLLPARFFDQNRVER